MSRDRAKFWRSANFFLKNDSESCVYFVKNDWSHKSNKFTVTTLSSYTTWRAMQEVASLSIRGSRMYSLITDSTRTACMPLSCPASSWRVTFDGTSASRFLRACTGIRSTAKGKERVLDAGHKKKNEQKTTLCCSRPVNDYNGLVVSFPENRKTLRITSRIQKVNGKTPFHFVWLDPTLQSYVANHEGAEVHSYEAPRLRVLGITD